MNAMYPENFRYTKEHEWVKVESGVATIGITFHAQKELGDIVYVELPKIGALVEQGKSLAVVESVKAASEIYAPVSGEVVGANDALANTPETLNADPHGEGWIAKIKLSAPEEVDRLLSATDYQNYLGAE
jgi:glycine cleavage system H protein